MHSKASANWFGRKILKATLNEKVGILNSEMVVLTVVREQRTSIVHQAKSQHS
jgi:hypothetical protein